MFLYIARRIPQVLIVLFGVSIITFFLMHLTGDPTMLLLPADAPKDAIEELRREMGFDDPLLVQYWRFIKGAIRGDFGMSLKYRRDAMGLVMERLPATLELSALAMLYAIVVAIPVGILAAIKRNTLVDYLTAVLTLFGQSMPTFWLGIMLIMIFSVNLGWLPTSGRGTWQQLILPSITLGTCYLAMLSRLTRSGFLEVWGKEYIRTARAKGLPEKTVIFKHTLKNSMIPLVTVMGLSFGGLLGGSVLTETVFEWPGIGQLAIMAIYGRDYPIQQTIVLMLGVTFIAITFITDLIYTWLDPRIRLTSKE